MTGWSSPTHMAILFVLALLLFGAKRLPEIGRSLGGGMREFRDSLTGQAAGNEAREPAPVSETAARTTAVRGRETA